MRALITGSAGFIGSFLCERFLSEGTEVVAVDNLSTGRKKNIQHLISNPNFELHIGDIRDKSLMMKLTKKSDIIFHFASALGVKLIHENPLDSLHTNTEGTKVTLNAAASCKKKVIFTSSSEIYGRNPRSPLSERADTLINLGEKRWHYSVAKAIGEYMLLFYHQEYDLPVLILRLFNIIGPRQSGKYGMVVPRFISQSLQGKPILVYGDGNQKRCFLDVRDTIEAIYKLSRIEDAEGQIFNIGSTKEITILELAKKIKKLTASHSEIQCVPYPYSESERIERRIPDISKSENYIGKYIKHSLEDTLIEIIHWFSKNE